MKGTSKRFKAAVTVYVLILLGLAAVAFMGLVAAVGVGWAVGVTAAVLVLLTVVYFAAGRGGKKDSEEVDTL